MSLGHANQRFVKGRHILPKEGGTEESISKLNFKNTKLLQKRIIKLLARKKKCMRCIQMLFWMQNVIRLTQKQTISVLSMSP